MTSFLMGFIMGFLATALVTGVYIAYLLGEKSASKKIENNEKKIKEKKVKNKKKFKTNLKASNFGNGPNQTKFPVSTSINTKDKS
ncbi:MAG: hypothetical protein ACQEQF_01695 [Bacillota bacterium]